MVHSRIFSQASSHGILLTQNVAVAAHGTSVAHQLHDIADLRYFLGIGNLE